MAPRRRRRSSSVQPAEVADTEQPSACSGGCSGSSNIDQSMDVDEPQLFIRTSDLKRFVLLKSQASCFNALHMILDDCTANVTSNSLTESIYLKAVHSNQLSKILEWTELYCPKHHSYYGKGHQGYGKGLWKPDSVESLPDGATAFLASLDEEEMLKVMHVANYLDVRCLFGACCQKIGKRWEGRSVEELRKLYKIESDFRADEEATLRVETKRLGLQD